MIHRVGFHVAFRLWLALTLLVLLTGTARAEFLDSRASARLSVGGVMMTTDDQLGRLQFDRVGGMAGLQFGYLVAPWLDLYLVLQAEAFPSEDATGIVFSPGLGARLVVPNDAVRPYLQLDVEPAFTGDVTRPMYRIGVGVDFRIAASMTLGPLLGYGRVIQHDIPGASTDAGFVIVGLSLCVRASDPQQEPEPPAAPPTPPAAPPHFVRLPPLPPAHSTEELMRLVEQAVPRDKVELLAPVLFQFDSDTLEPIGVAMLHEVARELQKRSDIELVEIQGYTDQRGDDDYNAELSARRAQRVMDWLTEHGVEAERLRIAPRGESELLESGEEEANHEQNRRVVFRVVRMKGDP